MAGYSVTERLEIAAGTFFTQEELAANPRLGDCVVLPTRAATDPNNRPMTAKDRAAVEAMVQVCAYCLEPGDARSALVKTARNDRMHPECDEAWTAEVEARKAGGR